MELLTLVNLVLPKLGEHAVTSLDVKHPTVAVILPILDSKITSVLLRGWWFNSYKRTLYPGEDKSIALPASVLSFVPKCSQAAQRNGQLFNTETGLYEWDAPVEGEFIEKLLFEECPPVVQDYLWYSTLVDAYVTDLGLAEDVRVWMRLADDALASMESEHLKQKRYSLRDSRQYRRYRSALRG